MSRDYQHPHQQLHDFAMAEGSASASASASGSSHTTTFTRLAKLLHQSSAITSRSNLQPPQMPSHDALRQANRCELGLGLGEEAPRRLSWER